MKKGTGYHGYRPSSKPRYSGPGEYLTITPEKDPGVVRRHVERYEKAVRLITDSRGVGGRWLDCACGTGYGSKVIMDLGGAEEYWGIDRNAVAISLARRHFGNRTETGGRFMQANIKAVEHWLPSLGPFDAILSIETLEHLPINLQTMWIRVASRNLTQDGMMVIACPIGRDGPSDYNRYHLFEPTLLTLGCLLDSMFEYVAIEALGYVDTGGKEAMQALAVCAGPRTQETRDKGSE